jgi:hypothetical protein
MSKKQGPIWVIYDEKNKPLKVQLLPICNGVISFDEKEEADRFIRIRTAHGMHGLKAKKFELEVNTCQN